jgi:MFS family permease
MKHFYGWRVVFGGGALQFFQSMLLNQAFGAYLAALVQDTGWSKTALSGAAALKSTESALLGPVLGWMVDRFGSQIVVRAGVILFGIGFMLLSQTDTLMTFYAAFVVLALGASMCSNMVVSRRHNPVVPEAAGSRTVVIPVRRRGGRPVRVCRCMGHSNLRLACRRFQFRRDTYRVRLAACDHGAQSP